MLFDNLPTVTAPVEIEKYCTENDINYLRFGMQRLGARCYAPSKADLRRLARGGWLDEDRRPTWKARQAVEDYEKRKGL